MLRSKPLIAFVISLTVASLASASQADLRRTLNKLRAEGCTALHSQALPLRRNSHLDEAAQQMSRGQTLHSALNHSGYLADASAALHVTGPETEAREALQKSGCATLANAEYRDLGVFSQPLDTWIVLAAPYVVPSAAEQPDFAARALALVNGARARGATCGVQRYGAAPPLRHSADLESAAAQHAAEMARTDYFDHRDRQGHVPSDRVSDTSYHAIAVGENIAYGPTTPEEVVNGWLKSPAHCENLMNAHFKDMGIAFAAGHTDDRPGLYWVQVFAAARY